MYILVPHLSTPLSPLPSRRARPSAMGCVGSFPVSPEALLPFPNDRETGNVSEVLFTRNFDLETVLHYPELQQLFQEFLKKLGETAFLHLLIEVMNLERLRSDSKFEKFRPLYREYILACVKSKNSKGNNIRSQLSNSFSRISHNFPSHSFPRISRSHSFKMKQQHGSKSISRMDPNKNSQSKDEFNDAGATQLKFLMHDVKQDLYAKVSQYVLPFKDSEIYRSFIGKTLTSGEFHHLFTLWKVPKKVVLCVSVSIFGDLLLKYLNDNGYHTDRVQREDQVMALLQSSHYDVLIILLGSSEADGINIIESYRSNQHASSQSNHKMRFIGILEHDDQEARAIALCAGYEAVFVAPFDFSNLKGAMHNRRGPIGSILQSRSYGY